MMILRTRASLPPFLGPALVFLIGLAVGCSLEAPQGTTAQNPTEPYCTPGDQKACDCPGGTVGVQLCAEDGLHFESCSGCNPEPTGCSPETECTPGSTMPCGNCGVMVCNAACQWSACTGEGECTPGDSTICGHCGTQACSATCAWSDCTDQGTCAPGDVEPCGNCGSHVCTDACDWNACADEGVCAPGDVVACGPVGDCGTKLCGVGCDWGVCTGICTDGYYCAAQVCNLCDVSSCCTAFGYDLGTCDAQHPYVYQCGSGYWPLGCGNPFAPSGPSTAWYCCPT